MFASAAARYVYNTDGFLEGHFLGRGKNLQSLWLT
jgi:hypothetical protein